MRRILHVFACLFVLATAALGSELKIKIIDPQSAVVARARVALYSTGSSTARDIKFTTSEGTVTFSNIAPGQYRVHVLAAGFSSQEFAAAVPQETMLTVKLLISGVKNTVEVSSTRTPLPASEDAAEVAQLDQKQLVIMQPVVASEAIRFLPGAVVNDAGRLGGLSSLFVRGGDSRYNKVIVDDVVVNDPGGTFDFGVLPMTEMERMEFVRGAESTLYGSDAMTSVVQMWTRNGTTRIPELRFGAEGGTFATARGYMSLSGARGRFDYNLFGEQFNTSGQGINDNYSNSSQGASVGVQLSTRSFFRFHARHANNRSGVQSFWNFNGQPLVPPDSDQYSRQNSFLGSAELSIAAPARWQHRFTVFEYNHKRVNIDRYTDPGRVAPFMGMYFSFDSPFYDFANINRAGMEYQGEYSARSWARSVFGYRFEDENGWAGDKNFPPVSHGLRRNHAVFGQQILTWTRVSLIAGLRYEHNESFGNKAIPRLAASFLAFRGGHILSGTRLHFAYSTGIKAPRFEESFGIGGFNIVANPSLKAEENRSTETGVQQNFLGDKVVASATYFNNQFRNQIDFITTNPATFEGKYINVNKSMAHGAEMEVNARLVSRLNLQASYMYLSSQILAIPLCGAFCDPLRAPGAPLLRRPKHSGTLLATWSGSRWGASLGGSLVGRRSDSDFMGLLPPVTYAAGYARVDLGVWRTITPRVTAYVKIGNVLNRHYEEVAGYPALRANFRAGMRFRIGGE